MSSCCLFGDREKVFVFIVLLWLRMVFVQICELVMNIVVVFEFVFIVGMLVIVLISIGCGFYVRLGMFGRNILWLIILLRLLCVFWKQMFLVLLLLILIWLSEKWYVVCVLVSILFVGLIFICVGVLEVLLSVRLFRMLLVFSVWYFVVLVWFIGLLFYGQKLILLMRVMLLVSIFLNWVLVGELFGVVSQLVLVRCVIVGDVVGKCQLI